MKPIHENPSAPQPAAASSATSSAKEIAKFDALAAEWWDEQGAMRLLHRLNPLRLAWIREHAEAHFGLPMRSQSGAPAPLRGLKVLDIGCGGGLLTEPLARLGASVTGLDESRDMIESARAHAAAQNLKLDYRCMSAAALAQKHGAQFHIVCLMEVIEHVPQPAALVQEAAQCLAPNGLLFAATLNRTPASFLLAILGAEYVLNWVARGTHDWRKFLRPHEFAAMMRAAGLRLRSQSGARYNPLTAAWRLTHDMRVNYMLCAAKPPKN